MSSTSRPDESENSIETILEGAHKSLRNNVLPVEVAMQNIYNGRMANRSLPPSNIRHALTKKQIPHIASQFSNSADIEELLRNLLKIGENRMSRLVDSTMATDYLYSDYCRDGDNEQFIRRIVSAQVLSEDAASGGRFKRRSCLFVSAHYGSKNNIDMNEVQVTLVNGGWIAVDPSVKATAEGRKFAASSSAVKKGKNSKNEPLILTAADERIAHRLECLALGDIWQNESEQENDTRQLEVDVREALTKLNLPLTSQGATEALVMIGRWTKDTKNITDSKSRDFVQHWSPELLDAARSLAQSENKRRELYAKVCYSSNGKRSAKTGLDGRIDLTALPCVCVDAQRTSFRDDSIGIRLRSSTGRKVNKAASKWEILVHIADVSDIYFGQSDVSAGLLRQAAERRGQSRYDLPLGE